MYVVCCKQRINLNFDFLHRLFTPCIFFYLGGSSIFRIMSIIKNKVDDLRVFVKIPAILSNMNLFSMQKSYLSVFRWF